MTGKRPLLLFCTRTSGRNPAIERGMFISLLVVLALAVGYVPPARAAEIIMRIRVVNRPNAKEQKVSVKRDLPVGIRPENVTDSAGLNIGYNIKEDRYFVRGEVELGTNSAQSVKNLEVVLEDVWTFPADKIETLKTRATEAVTKLKKKESEFMGTATNIRDKVVMDLNQLLVIQEENAIGMVPPLQHIRAYSTTRKIYGKAVKNLGQLENFLIMEGIDVAPIDPIVSEVEWERDERKVPSGGYKSAVMKIEVENTSPLTNRVISVRRDLPEEIGVEDVVDPDMLKVGYDARRKRTYVYINDLELAAREKKEFPVLIKDKWDINGDYIIEFTSIATNLLAVVSAEEGHEDLQLHVAGIIEELNQITAETKPETLGPEYVDFFRVQTRKLGKIKGKLDRLEEVLRRKKEPKWTTPMLSVKAPDPRTTWIIIYIVLGFLGLVSLLFFLRWFGKSKSEKLGDSGQE